MQRRSGCLLIALLLLTGSLPPTAAPAAGGESPAGRSETGEGPAARESAARDLAHAMPPGFLGAIDRDGIEANISWLQSLGTRFAYTEKDDEAADYIEGQFRALGLDTRRQEFTYNGFPMQNVLGVRPGRNATLPEYVLGAHYDSINGSDSLKNNYAPAPGADDDASGMAAVLAAARAFSRARTNSTVVFAAFAAEELGRIGSIEFVRRAEQEGTTIAAALCLDMIGYNHRYPKVDLVSNSESLWLSELAANASRRNSLGLITEKVVTNSTPTNWSDQVSFWEAGLPAMYFIEDENPAQNSSRYEANPYYHTGGDTLERLNLSLVTTVARLGAASLASLAGLALPDFWPELQDWPSSVLEGEPAFFNVLVHNDGEPEESVNLSLSVDGQPVLEREARPGEVAALRWNATRGSHLVSIEVDRADRHQEWNEADNRVDLTLNVLGRPDLAVSDFRTSDPGPLPGQLITFFAEVTNAGGTGGGGRFLIFSAEGGLPPIIDRPLYLWPGESLFLEASAVAPEDEATYTAMIVDVVPFESDIGNNLLNLTVTPDRLRREDFLVSAEPEAVWTFEPVRVGVRGAGRDFQCYFDFGDGCEAGWTDAGADAGAIGLSHDYSAPGTYFVEVSVRDRKGANVALEPVPVVVRDRPPVAVIAVSSAEARVNETLLFSAAGSYDSDGQILQYLWEFGDGARGTGVEVRHAFAALRTYLVRLTVMDDRWNSTIATLPLTVANSPPVARASARPAILFTGEDSFFNASDSRDPEGDALSCEWDFGDGGRALGAAVLHNFSKEGNFTVTLTVRDGWGAASSTTLEVRVYPRLSPLSAAAGERPDFVVPAVLIALIVAALALILRGRRKRGTRRRSPESGEAEE